MAALLLAVHRLADVVQQAGPFGHLRIKPDLRGQHRAEEGDFNRVVEGVLGVGKAELEPAEEVDDLRMKSVDLQALHGFLPRLHHIEADLLLGARDELLDVCRMDASVLDQTFERLPGDLAPHGVK